MDEPPKSPPPHQANLSTSPGWIIAGVIAVAAVLLLLASGFGSSSKPTPSPTPVANQKAAPAASAKAAPSPTAGLSACTASQLTANVLPGSGAAGTQYYTLSLTNGSQQGCTMSGYPGVSLVNDAGTQLGPAANRDTVSPVTSLTLDPGLAAYATLGLPNPGNYNPGACSDTSTSLKVFPPGQTSFLTTKFAAQACPGWTVTAVHATQP